MKGVESGVTGALFGGSRLIEGSGVRIGSASLCASQGNNVRHIKSHQALLSGAPTLLSSPPPPLLSLSPSRVRAHTHTIIGLEAQHGSQVIFGALDVVVRHLRARAHRTAPHHASAER